MDTISANAWQIWFLRGIIAIFLGLLCFAWRNISFHSLMVVFSVFMLINGLFAFTAMLPANESEPPSWTPLVEGVAGISTGLIILFSSAVTIISFVIYVAGWALFTGLLQILLALRLRSVIDTEWALGLAGATSLLLGFVFAIFPEQSVTTIAWTLGTYAILFGILMIVVSDHFRQILMEDSAGRLKPRF